MNKFFTAVLLGSTVAYTVANVANADQIVYGAMLPASRSVLVGATETVGASIVNPYGTVATGCTVALNGSYPVTVTTTPPLADISANGSAAFTVSLTASQAMAPQLLSFRYDCTNRDPAPTYTHTNTLTFSANLIPTPDVISMAATAQQNGIVSVPGVWGATAFAVATTNIGSGDWINVHLNTGHMDLPLTLKSCVTNALGQCTTPIQVGTSFWSNAGANVSLAVFVYGQGIPMVFNPAEHRINVLMKDSGGTTRGATSVAAQIIQ